MQDDILITGDENYYSLMKNRLNCLFVVPRNIKGYDKIEPHYASLYDIDFSPFSLDVKFVQSLMQVDLKKNEQVIYLPEFREWKNQLNFDPLLISGKIVNGFNRGSKQLGVPTANIDMTTENQSIAKQLVPGVYSAIGTFKDPKLEFLRGGKKYKCALSIGWNPVFDNSEKTIEVFLINDFGQNDFYG